MHYKSKKAQIKDFIREGEACGILTPESLLSDRQMGWIN